jgi:F-type H+-transporting ATPase subunit gamma
MKALAAVSIRQYQKAVESLSDYEDTVERGLQILLKAQEEAQAMPAPVPLTTAGVIVFGSDQGLCGQFNAQVVAHAFSEIETLRIPEENRYILTVGERVKDHMERADQGIYDNLASPGSTAGITPMVQEIVMILQEWYFGLHIQHIYLFFNHYVSGATFRPHTLRLLPMDRSWLEGLKARKWDSKTLPLFTMEWEALFAALIREYLFVSLYRAFTDSLASENASRLAAMQNAEKNIQEHLEEVFADYHRQRQMTITEELLDIVSGYEAMKGDTRQVVV